MSDQATLALRSDGFTRRPPAWTESAPATLPGGNDTVNYRSPEEPGRPDRAEDLEIVGRSPLLSAVLEQARRVACSKAAVLIEGESGTGKELLARLIHQSGPRARQPFIRVNCAALSETLVESELFGHEKGAFTGADEARPGRFELADQGTLLLDEISEMPVKLQAKLLRVLEEEAFERVGGVRTRSVNVRVLATTNRDVALALAEGSFRDDLYYRLSAVTLRLPPLRARRQDIPELVEHFFRKHRHEAPAPLQGVSPKSMSFLTAHDWPGNVRQLRNALHRACLLADGPEILPRDLPLPETVAVPEGQALCRTLEEIERQAILSTLQNLGGNKTAAARLLGVTSRTLLNKLNRYRLNTA